MGEEYTLRGHHIDSLRKYVNEAGSNMLMAIMILSRNYGNFAGVAASKIDLMMSHPENQILITDGLDDICNARCPYRNGGSCQRDEHVVTDEEAAEFDRGFIKKFGLEIGKKYLAKDLILRIR